MSSENWLLWVLVGKLSVNLQVFLSNRTQQVKVANSLSIKCDVISGTIQGSVLGPVLYTMLNNSLLRTIKKNSKMSLIDDFKMIADVTVKSKAKVQLEIDSIAK